MQLSAMKHKVIGLHHVLGHADAAVNRWDEGIGD